MIYLVHPETHGTTRVPDEPDVIAWHEARGWCIAEEPAPAPFVPVPDGGQGEEQGWVELVHPLSGGRATWPANAEALQGAYDSGWVHESSPAAATRATRATRATTTTRSDSA